EGNYATKLGPDLNILEYSIKNGTCISTDTIRITNSTASKAHAGNDRNICVDTVVLSANIPQYYTSYGWELLTGAGDIAPADLDKPYAVVRNLGSGRNRFRWVINNGTCQSVDDVEIANNFIQANAGLNNTICTDTLILEANNPSPGVGSWGVVGGSGSAQFENAGVPNTVVRNLDQGSNLITWTILNVGCKSVSTIDIVNDKPTLANAGANKAICDSSIALSGNTPSVGSATWSVVSGSGNFVSPVSPTTTVNGLAFGKNLFRWSIVNNACTSYDDVEIAYNTVYATVGENQVLCGNTTSLEASSAAPGLGTWSIVGGTSQAAFANVNDPNTTVSNLGRGKNILRWSITNQGCTTTADVEVTNDLPSDAYAGNNQEICVYNTTLDATAVTIGTGSWHVLTGAGIVTALNEPKSAITSLSQGDNVLQWRVVNNLCTLTDEVLIKNNIPSQPYAGSDFESCNNTINLKAAPPAYGAGTWSIVSGAGNIRFINQPETEVTNLKADINVFKWEVVRGNCRLQDSITVTNNTPTKANAGPDIHDCKDNAILDGNIATNGTGNWSIVTGSAVFVDPTDPKTKVTGLGFGDNSVQWTISKGSCFTSDIVMVFNKVPDQSKAGVDQVVCDNYTTLNANDPTSGTGTWVVMSGLGEFEDRNNYQSKVNNIGFGENVYKWTIQYGSCSTFDLVAVRSNKAYADAGADDVTYTGSYELAANKEDNTPGTWEVLAGQGAFVDANNFNTVVSGLRSGVNTFRWKIIVDNCEAFDDVSVTYKVVPDADFIASTTDGCSPLTVKFTNYTVGRDSTFYWEFDDGATSSLRHPTHTFQDPGVYTVTLTAQGPDGIDATSTMVITVRPHPVADFSATPEVVYVPGDQVRFYNFSVDAVAYKWYFGHDNDMSIERNPIYEYPETGVYSVALMVENIYHCTDSVYKADFITAKQQGFIVFPNAFTPRGDSNVTGGISSTDKNAIFRPIFKYVDQYEIQIFNQWGQMVYSSNSIDEGWNGEFNGQIVPQGVYVWKVTGKFLSGKGFSDVGNVMVVR
ncbi:MAG: gliding motility-associated C-terminal domain-containing protein, partial [Breznakibacter sp.]|nr:gliding motility-associated C-terminal domain-containing protein [Breznakibacter sp.]